MFDGCVHLNMHSLCVKGIRTRCCHSVYPKTNAKYVITSSSSVSYSYMDWCVHRVVQSPSPIVLYTHLDLNNHRINKQSSPRTQSAKQHWPQQTCGDPTDRWAFAMRPSKGSSECGFVRLLSPSVVYSNYICVGGLLFSVVCSTRTNIIVSIKMNSS